jgi:hypothetical protein
MRTPKQETTQRREPMNWKTLTSKRNHSINVRTILIATIAAGLLFWSGATGPVKSHGTAEETETTAPSTSYCIYNNSTSTIEVRKAYEVAPLDRGRYKCGSKFPGSFLDPRNGGECWKCPKGFSRTIWAVTGGTACEKGGPFGQHRRATLAGKPGCPPDTWRDVLSDNCGSCPVGYKRSAHVRSNLDIVPNACIAIKGFAYKLKPKERACGDEFRNNERIKVKFYMALEPGGTIKELQKYCRWAKAEKIPLPKPTPALTPTMQCPLFEFEIPGTGSAKVTGGAGDGYRLGLFTNLGVEYDYATNGYTIVPAPRPIGQR